MDTTQTPEIDDFMTPAPVELRSSSPVETPGAGQTEATTRPEFHIDTREKAEWYLQRLATLNADEARIIAQSEAMLKRIRSDRESLQGRFDAEFQSFTRGELAKQKGSRRSVLFFNGTAQFTSVAPRLVVKSEADAITTARAVKPETVTEETITKLDKKAFLAYATQQFEETGELLPGLDRTEAGERFAIKFPSEGRASDPEE